MYGELAMQPAVSTWLCSSVQPNKLASSAAQVGWLANLRLVACCWAVAQQKPSVATRFSSCGRFMLSRRLLIRLCQG